MNDATLSATELSPYVVAKRNLRVVFNHMWGLAPKRDFDPAWEDGTGHFDGLTSVCGVPMFASTDPTGRKILYIGQMQADESPLILFEMFKGSDGLLYLHAPDYYLYGGDRKFPSAGHAGWALPRLADILSNQLIAFS